MTWSTASASIFYSIIGILARFYLLIGFFTLFLHIAAAFKMNYGIGDDRPSPFPWLGYHRSPAVPHHPEMIHILGL